MNAPAFFQAAEMVTRLEVLAAELARLGWTGRLIAPAGRFPQGQFKMTLRNQCHAR